MNRMQAPPWIRGLRARAASPAVVADCGPPARLLARFVVTALLSAVATVGPPAAAPAAATTLFAMIDTGELFASSDQGATWTVRAALPVSDATALIAVTAPQHLAMVSGSGTFYRSLDAGATWSTVGAVPASDVVDLAGRPDGGLLVLTRTGTLWRSTDEGATFSALGASIASNHVAVTLGSDSRLYALTATGDVARSDDGATWAVVGTLPVSDAVSIRRADAALYVLAGTGLTFRSTDGAATWTAVGTVSQVGMTGLTPIAGQLVAVSREGHVARSAAGATWTWVGTVNQLQVTALASDVPQAVGLPEPPRPAPRFVLAPPSPNPLLAGRILTLRFSVATEDAVALEMLDARGRHVASRAPEVVSAADDAEIRWDPGPLAPGVYFLRLAGRSGLAASARVVVLR